MELFNNIKVLELASVLAGPAVGQFFAELGAEVIKIENEKTGGDVTRSWRSAGEKTDDRSAYFCSVNWGKKSVTLDMSEKEGRKALHTLAATSDIVITSFKPGDASKLGADYETLSQFNRAIIYGEITGYGSHDPRVGYDAVIQAESGFMSLNGEKNAAPLKMPVALIDVLAAHQLKEGLLVAMLARERKGKGSKVEVSLMDTALASLANQSSNWQVGRVLPSRQGSLHPNIAPYGEMFTTRDGKHLLLAVGTDKQFVELLLALGLDSIADDARFQSNERRVANRTVLSGLISSAVQQLDSDKLLEEVHSRKIPAGLVQDIQEAMESDAAHRLLLSGDGLVGTRTFVSLADGQPFASRKLSPPPHLGEHTSEVLAALSANI
jgi:crotonobetainyl-CoA:carnitine CoA-transferase CaiB-like acyl-CoA transferase